MNFQNVLPRATLRSVFNQDCEAEDWREVNAFCYLKAVFSAEPPVDSDFLSFIQFTICMSQNRLQLTTSFFVTFHVCRKSKFVANMCSKTQIRTQTNMS